MSFGQELPDQVDTLDRRLEAQLVLLTDVQLLIRERAALEAQYSKSLQATAKKAEKLVQQHATAAALGENPSKGVNEDLLGRSTLFKALSFLAEALDRTAQEHMSFSEVLSIQVADDLKALEKKKEETRKKHLAFYTKLVGERETVYNSRIKAQSKYYSQCEEVEASRQKQDRAGDDKHIERATRQLEDAQAAMLDAKNTYLIGIAMSNKAKNKFYDESVPALEDQYQLLQTSTTSRLSYILLNYCSFNSSHLSTLTQTVSSLQARVNAINHQADDELFIDMNRRPFAIPANWEFEPCPTFYDTSNMCVEPEPKVLLQNKMARAKAKLSEIRPILKAKEAEANKLKDLSVKYAADPNLGSADTTLDDAFEAFHAALQLELTQTIHEEEVRIIAEAVDGDTGGQSPHSFKSSSFAVPTTCGYCQTSIWGLTKQGKTCKACGLNVHSKCELKVPAECSGTKEGGSPTVTRHRSTASKARISVTSVPIASAASPPKSSSQLSPPTSTSSHSFAKSQGTFLTAGAPSASEPDGTVAFDFTASSTFELTATAGVPIWIVEEDDGSGWTKVSDGRKSGLVPSSYLQIHKAKLKDAKTSTTMSKRVRGLFAYEAQGDDEIAVTVGGIITLTPNGELYGNGWYEGVDSNGRQGVFPSNYVELF